jgi:hypothetical protein
MDIKSAIENTKKIYLSDSLLNILMDFERVIDEMDLYAFANWEKGELVEGPNIEKYWVSCKFMWPRKMMPDPSGAERLLPYGVKVSYEKKTIQIPTKIKAPDDFRPDGSRKGKLIDVPVWLVNIKMPKELIADIEQGSLEIAGEDIDLEDIQNAYQQGIDQQANVETDQNTDQYTAGAPSELEAGLGNQGMAANVPQI